MYRPTSSFRIRCKINRLLRSSCALCGKLPFSRLQSNYTQWKVVNCIDVIKILIYERKIMNVNEKF